MLGIATISALAGWKRTQQLNNALDTHELVDKARSIELAYLTILKQPSSSSIALTTLPPPGADGEQGMTEDPVPISYEKPIDRPGVTAVFRAAAKVYLQTVVAGSSSSSSTNSNPTSAPTSTTTSNASDAAVSKAVSEAIEIYKSVPNAEADRALVFALTITACVAREEGQRGYILQRFSFEIFLQVEPNEVLLVCDCIRFRCRD